MPSYIHNALRPHSHYFQRAPELWVKMRESRKPATAADKFVKCAIATINEAGSALPKLITGTASNRLSDHGAACPQEIKMSLQSLGALGVVNVALAHCAGFVGSYLCAIIGVPVQVSMGMWRRHGTVSELAREGWKVGAEFGIHSVGNGVFLMAEALRSLLRLVVIVLQKYSLEVSLGAYKNSKVFVRHAYLTIELAVSELRHLPHPGGARPSCAA